MTDFVIAPIGAMAMCGALFGIFWVSAQTRHSLEVTARMFEPEKAPVPVSSRI
jgi:hypothetical protein